jgi:hypothetical protein
MCLHVISFLTELGVACFFRTQCMAGAVNKEAASDMAGVMLSVRSDVGVSVDSSVS